MACRSVLQLSLYGGHGAERVGLLAVALKLVVAILEAWFISGKGGLGVLHSQV